MSLLHGARWSGRCSGLLFVLVLLGSFLPAAAQGAILTYSFSGEITAGPTKGLPGINVGDNFSGTVTYDTQTKLQFVLGGVSFYNQGKVVPPSGMQLVVDGQDFSTPSSQAWTIGVSDNDPTGYDAIAFSHKIPIAPNPNLPGTTELQIIVQLGDSTQTLFSNESLPAALSPESFDLKTLRIVTSYLTVGAGYVGTIDNFALVPEPAPIALLASIGPLLAIYAVRSRRRRFSRASW